MAHPREVLRKHVTGSITKREQNLSTPEKHQLKVARDSMRMHCVGLSILGRLDHYESASIIERLTLKVVGIDTDCTCKDSQ